MENRRPNIVLIMCDQLRWCEVGCYGNAAARTPHIDRLAAGGLRFDLGCTNSPLCTPSRAVCLSGQYARTCNGILGGLGESTRPRVHLPDATIAEVLRSAGYRTGLIGSWNVQPKPDLVGFDHCVFPTITVGYHDRTYFVNSDEPTQTSGWVWDFEYAEAREFLAGTRDSPFFLYYNIEQPHMPLMDAPAEVLRRFSRDDIVLRPNVPRDGKLPYDEEWFRIYLWEQNQSKPGEPDSRPPVPEGIDLMDLIALYYCMASLVDDQVGRLLDMLAEFDLDKSTIVAFVSDHGDSLGSHGWWNKCRPNDESIRIPMIVRDPRYAAGRVSSQAASMVDLMPTLLGLAEIDVPGHVAGEDLSAIVRGSEDAVGENCIFVEYIQGVENDDLIAGIGIRTGDYLYGMRLAAPSLYSHGPEGDAIADDRHCFFDMRADPYQMHNLAKTDALADVAAALRDQLRKWHESTPWLTPMQREERN